jgi:hypothetical protein
MTDNRIVQGGELDLESNSLEDVIVNPVTSDSKPVSSFVNGIKNVDMSYLDGRLINYLGAVGGDPSPSYNFIKVYNLLNPEITEIVKSLGNSFFKISDLRYEHSKSGRVVIGDLTLNPEIPYESLKRAIAVSIGDEHVDYFLEEFSDRLEITDETKNIDASKPELQPYLPGIAQVRKLSGKYTIMADVYLLLLTLNPEDREPLTFFFNAARESKVYPFSHKFEAQYTLSENNNADINEYCLTLSDMNTITQNPHIIPFHEIVRIGGENKIKGIAEYTDRLENFRDSLRNIPGP